MILKVHRSNYEHRRVHRGRRGPGAVRSSGSRSSPTSAPACSTPPARGSIRPAPERGSTGEPAARQTLAAGADLVLFSGDKLFGGPQAGIIAGRRELVERCGRHPLARALRPGDLVLQVLQRTTLAYLDRRGRDIPFWRLATIPAADLALRAEAMLDGPLGDDGRVRSAAMDAVPGGGTLPTVTIPSRGLRIDGDVTAVLRARPRPLVARVEDGATWIDLRTVDPDDDVELAAAVAAAFGIGGDSP